MQKYSHVKKNRKYFENCTFMWVKNIKYTSKTFSGKVVLFRSVTGEFTADAEICMLRYAIVNDLINEAVCGMVIDLSAAQFKMEIGEVNKILDYVSGKFLLATLKYAIIVLTPEQIIHPLLGGIYNDKVKMNLAPLPKELGDKILVNAGKIWLNDIGYEDTGGDE